MSTPLIFLLFIVSCLVLFASGSFFIRSLSRIASFLRMSEFVVSFIIVGFATSIPELFVGISAALAGNPSLSLGNVIGSNIANLTIILGIPVLLARRMKIESKIMRRDGLYMFGISLLPLILMVIGNGLSRIDGVILIAFFIVYCAILIKQRKSFKKHVEDGVSKLQIIGNVFLFIISGITLYYAADFTVKYATELSLALLLPPLLIGLFLVALGTSLPELVVGINSVIHKHEEMVFGNILGSVVANSTIILGVTALIHPITANLFIFFVSIGFMILSTLLFITSVKSGDEITWKEAIAMIMLYVIFLVVQFYIR